MRSLQYEVNLQFDFGKKKCGSSYSFSVHGLIISINWKILFLKRSFQIFLYTFVIFWD